MLEIIDIDTYYGTSQILHGLSLDLKSGEMEGILGRNGAGKTTLLRSIIGINPPRTGTIRFNGHDITHLKPYQRTKYKIAYVPQGREIIPDLSVYDNLRLAVIAQGDRKGKIPDFVFDYFPKLKDIQKRKAGFLSGGEQQQLAIGRALAQQPDLLLLDEPTEGLQPSIVEEIENDIKLIHKENNNTILIVEQRLDFIRELTDRFSIIENGRIAVRGATNELTDDIIKKHLSL